MVSRRGDKSISHIERHNQFWVDFVAPAVMRRDNHKCVKCGSTKSLDVSHNKYGPDITINDLETLCRSCHKKKDHSLGLLSKNFK